jgi:HAMP domain-containing protein
LNALILPVLALTIALMIAVDYRQEIAFVMAAHAIHAAPADSPQRAGPIDPATSPEAAGRSTLVVHTAFGGLALLVVLAAINVALSLFVFRPLNRLRSACTQMQRGQWHQVLPRSSDEMGAAVAAFQQLGLTLDAFVGQALQAERLGTLALLARMAAAQIEPEIACIGASVGRLHGTDAAPAREEAHVIANASARILASVRGLDHAFEASFRRTKGGAQT